MIVKFEQPEWRIFCKEIGVIDTNEPDFYDRHDLPMFKKCLDQFNARHIRWKAHIDFDAEEDYMMFKLKYNL